MPRWWILLQYLYIRPKPNTKKVMLSQTWPIKIGIFTYIVRFFQGRQGYTQVTFIQQKEYKNTHFLRYGRRYSPKYFWRYSWKIKPIKSWLLPKIRLYKNLIFARTTCFRDERPPSDWRFYTRLSFKPSLNFL